MARKAAKNQSLVLRHPPIIEAVLDIDCDLPPAIDLDALKDAARERFAPRYPKPRLQIVQHREFTQEGDAAPTYSASQGIQALQFLSDEENQVVQVRADGFSFNRLAPYTTLDTYLPEIEWGWVEYRDLVSPVQVRAVRLRFINRILLPAKDGAVNLDEYLEVGPQLRGPEGLLFQSLLHRYNAVEESSGNDVSIVLATEAAEANEQGVILDITTSRAGSLEPGDWV